MYQLTLMPHLKKGNLQNLPNPQIMICIKALMNHMKNSQSYFTSINLTKLDNQFWQYLMM